MSYFVYRAIDPDGAAVSGMTEAEDIEIASASLSTKGLSILDVREANRIIASLRKRYYAHGIKRSDIIEFATNLSVMLKAGVPIVTALEDLLITLENKYMKAAVADMKNRVESGMRFSDAVEFQGGLFPGIFIKLVRVGEETGRLDKSLNDVAVHLQKMEDLSQAIKRALLYPAFATIATTGALVFWLAYVLPRIMDAIKGMGITLPLITRILLQVSYFTRVYWFIIPLAPAAAFAAVYILKQNAATRYAVDMFKIKLPVIKLVVYNKLLALFSEQMRILIMAGITIDRSLGIVAEVMSNEVFRRAVLDVKESVSSGNSVADSLRAHKVFPQLVIRMVGIGETSGSLDEQLGFLSEYYLKRLDDVAQKLGKMVEPLVLGIVGMLFAVIIIGLMVPLYDLVTHFGKM